MRVQLFIRRLHMYLGILLLPWFIIYAAGALVLNHPQLLAGWYGRGSADWTPRFERAYHCDVPPGAKLRPIAARVIEDMGLRGSFWVYMPNDRRLNIQVYKFRSATRLTCFLDQDRVIAEDKRFRWDHFLTGLHERAGFVQESLLADLWGVIVDLVGLAVVVWVGTGFYAWWTFRIRRLRGGVALAAGLLAFIVLVLTL